MREPDAFPGDESDCANPASVEKKPQTQTYEGLQQDIPDFGARTHDRVRQIHQVLPRIYRLLWMHMTNACI